MPDCLFCGSPEFTENVIDESEELWIVADPCPVNPGHILLVPKRHVEDYGELTDDEAIDVKENVHELEKKLPLTECKRIYEGNLESRSKRREACKEALETLKNGFNPDGFNVGLNMGESAGQTVDHLHVHLIPRSEGDVENPEGGVRGVIPSRKLYRGEK